MLPTDRKQWSRWDGSKSATVFPDIEPPAGWLWETDWQLDMEGIADAEGWVYALDMKQFVLPHNANAAHKGPLYFVRRRRWVRGSSTLHDLTTHNTTIMLSRKRTNESFVTSSGGLVGRASA